MSEPVTTNVTLDTRDLIARFEELENQELDGDEKEEFQQLTELLEELQGNGGDEQWRGYWYPITLIRDDYFDDYARELVVDCGYLPKELPSWIEIDWSATASNVQSDYTSCEIGGVTYWYR